MRLLRKSVRWRRLLRVSRRRRRALVAKRRVTVPVPSPVAEPLRRSTRKRIKKEFFYPSTPKKKKVSSDSASDESGVSDDGDDSSSSVSLTSPRSHSPLSNSPLSDSPLSDSPLNDSPPDTKTANGLALLAEVSKGDQFLLVDAGPPNERGDPVGRFKATGSRSFRRRRNSVIDVDMLRKLSTTKLISQFSEYSTIRVPKDAFSMTDQHSYSCTLLPGVCNEKFCGPLTDTKNQIKRHLLRHIGELLTIMTQNCQNLTPDNTKQTDPSAEHCATPRKPLEDSVTYAIPSGTRHVTVNLPKSLDVIESSRTIIRSSGVNEVILLPSGFISLSSMLDILNSKRPTQISQAEDSIIHDVKVEGEEDHNINTEEPAYQVLCNTTNLTNSEETCGAIMAPESQTVEYNIEVRTKRRKYTKRYDLPHDVGKCQRITDKTYSNARLSQRFPSQLPHSDHNYVSNRHIDDLPITSIPHTDSTGCPLSEPERSEVVDPQVAITGGPKTIQRSLKSKSGKSYKNVVKKPEPREETEEDKQIKKQALELLYSLCKKSWQRKGPFTCVICQKTVTAPGTLRAHYRSHAGIKPFACNQCDATFTRLHSLKYHLMIHNEQTRFMCDHCGREFRHSSHFREHLRRHTGEEPFGCTDCPLRFKTRNTYKRHLKRYHEKKLTAKGITLIKKE